MNYFASGAYDYKFPYPPNVVEVAKQTTFPKGGEYKDRREKLRGTIAHEIIEAELMRTDKNLPYKIAHMYAMEYEKGIYHHTDKIRVKNNENRGSVTHTVFRMYENKALIEKIDTEKNTTVYAGTIKDSKGKWRKDTDYYSDPNDLDEWWDNVEKK